MQRLLRTLAVAALFAAPALAAGTLEVTTPARGVTLRGGTTASLQWKADHLPRGAEEWEAFLSVDGGRYYAYRITPHLDIDLRHVTFIVPNVDTRNAKILIRTGDEEIETTFEIPGSFAIARDARAEQPASRPPGFDHAEAARVGDPEVLAWADGSRNGSGVRLHYATPVPSPSFDLVTPVSNDSSTILTQEEVFSRLSRIEFLPRSGVERTQATAGQRPRGNDLLLVCMRRNI